ncbi:MAG: hypothetical protein RBU37_16875 [Myxococcota bacterium]|jgi:hypothetical protein|nr:hypothetical protein [Myxococcota bacterium]
MKATAFALHVSARVLPTLLACAILLVASSARSDEHPYSIPALGPLQLGGYFSTMGLLRSDADFDDSPRYYDEDGQSEGQFATFLRPHLRLQHDALSLYYEAELGWNVWGMNNPDLALGHDEHSFLMKHRELWASWQFDEHVRLKAGYQRVQDISGLFLNHWLGAAELALHFDELELALRFGQLPEDRFEGIDVRDNNFFSDSFFAALLGRLELGDGLSLEAEIDGLADDRVTRRPLYLLNGVLGLRFVDDEVDAFVHLAGQWGEWTNAALGERDQQSLAWAAQAGLHQKMGDFCWGIGLLALSGDDADAANTHNGAYFASAKNQSRTLMLSEDEFRDRYDNLDERISTQWGAFSLNRSGLFLGDLSVGYALAEWYHPQLVLGAAFALEPANAFDEQFVGWETSLINRFPLAEYAELRLVGQLLVPGAAAAVFVNDVDQSATRPIGGAQLAFDAHF